MLSNSLALVAAKVALMGSGFVFWVLAARLFAPAEVGVAAGVVAAMMLCTQLALLGLGSAVIAEFPKEQRHPSALLNSALLLTTAAALLAGVLFMLLATGAFKELDVVTSSPTYAAIFVAASIVGTVGILLDQVSTALRRGDQVLVRGLLFGGTALFALTLIAATAGGGSYAIFLPWLVAGTGACAVGLRQVRMTLRSYRLSADLDREMATRLLRVGLPNYALTVAERAPGLVLPIVVTEILSPEANAAWYTLWMTAWVVFIVPIQVGMTLFAEVAHNRASLPTAVRRAIRTSLFIGGAGALVLLATAHVVLSVLGESYAEAGVTPLRILVLGLIPLTFMHAYFATCRAIGRLGEATATGWVVGVLSVIAGALAGVGHGLDGIAVAWVAVQSVGGAWSAWRLRRLLAQGVSGTDADASVARNAVTAPGGVTRVGQAIARHGGRALRTIANAAHGGRGKALAALLPIGIALALWPLGLGEIDVRQVSDLGLVSVVPATFFLSLAILSASFAVSLVRPRLQTGVVVLHVLALILILYGTPALIEDVTSNSVVWRHAGVIDHVLKTGDLNPSIDVYFNWPGAFLFGAMVTDLTGVDDARTLAAWAPVAFNVLYLAPLVAIAQALTRDRRVVWLSVWLFFVVNWVGQDYLAPQAVAYVLYLVLFAVVLTWFGGRTERQGGVGGWVAARLARRMPPRSSDPDAGAASTRAPSSSRQRAALMLACVLLIAATAPSHQLTPVAMAVSAAALVGVGACWLRGLPTIAVVLTLTWVAFQAVGYLSGHLPTILGRVGAVESSVGENVGSRVEGSGEHLIVVYVRLALTGVLWSLAVAGAVARVRAGHRDLAAAALALAPFVLLAVQPYGGEMLLRAYLFSLPFVAFFVAALIIRRMDPRREWRAAALIAALTVCLLSGAILARFGNERVALFTKGEVDAVAHVYDTARPGSTILASSPNVPWKSRHYADYHHRLLPRMISEASPARTPTSPRTVVRLIAKHGPRRPESATYVVLTRGQGKYDEMFGSPPWGSATALERALARSPRFQTVYRQSDARVFKLTRTRP